MLDLVLFPQREAARGCGGLGRSSHPAVSMLGRKGHGCDESGVDPEQQVGDGFLGRQGVGCLWKTEEAQLPAQMAPRSQVEG